MNRTIKIVCWSDTHTRHAEVSVPPGDILVYAGDMTDMGELESLKSFSNFLGTLPHPHKIVIAGNHDFCFQKKPEVSRILLTNCIYLEDKAVTIEGIRFYGSPWQPWFCDWAFNLPRGPLIRAIWDRIPENTDILLTHGPPYGHGDTTCVGEKVGCMDLLHAVERIKPKYHIFGHIHEAPGVSSNGVTTFVNASTCNFKYEPVHPPIVLEYNIGLSR